MQKNRLFIILYCSILLLSIILRLYHISTIPPGVNRDEASIGYTAYSLIHTGRDEYGRVFPFSFQSFGDWKLPLYIYESVITVSLFGLSEFAVRIPSAIAGIVTVAVVFFLADELCHDKRIAFLSMFLTAVSPWSIHLSRVESESNTAVLFTAVGVLCILKSVKKKQWLIIPGAVCLGLCYFTYAGNYVFTTLLVIGLFLFYRTSFRLSKYVVSAVTIFCVLFVFIVFQTTRANHTKLSGISIFGDPSVIHAQIEIPRTQHTNPQSLFARVFHNRIMFAGERFMQNYTNTFSANFLFINGGTNHAHNIENFGNMYIIESVFLFLGVAFLVIGQKGSNRNLLLWWFFVSPVAASITKDAPHTNRTAAILPILLIVVAVGLVWFFSRMRKRYQIFAIVGVTFLFVLNIGLYLDRYFVHFPFQETQNWGAPYKSLSTILRSSQYKGKHIIMTKPETSPYIYFLFYQAYDPATYQKQAVRYAPTEDGFVHVKAFDRYEFREIDWNADLKTGNNILIDLSSRVPEFVQKEYKTMSIQLPDNQSLFTLVESK